VAFGHPRHLRPSGAGSEDAWRKTSGDGKSGSQNRRLLPYPLPMRRAYHGAGNRLAPAVHFSEGGKTAYCNAALMQFALSAVMF